jgi:hypothetical protein
VIRTIEYDLKHGITKDEIISFLVTLKTEASFERLMVLMIGSINCRYALKVSKPKAAFSNDYVY